MLLNNFYTITDFQKLELGVTALIKINPTHEIFNGHFPNQPVVPGVCMVQIVKELMEQALQQALFLKEGTQLKFLQLLVPNNDDTIHVSIQYKMIDTSYTFNASFHKDDVAVFKMNGVVRL